MGGMCDHADGRMDEPNAHFPYTLVVPDYAALHGGAAYFTAVSNALTSYRAGVVGSSATGLHKALQLAGAVRFQSDASAIVTTRVKRSGLRESCSLQTQAPMRHAPGSCCTCYATVT